MEIKICLQVAAHPFPSKQGATSFRIPVKTGKIHLPHDTTLAVKGQLNRKQYFEVELWDPR